jgi:signal transduction histidine kinase
LEEIGLQIENLRSIVSDLRPAALDELGLAPALESLVARTQVAQGITVRASIELSDVNEGSARLPPEIETTVYRLVQESLNNVIKHAGARSAEVAVRASNGSVSVEVRDDGAGFDPGAPSSGFGLAGMHERVELAGGSLTVSSTSGEGTLVHALLPAPALGGQRRRIS